MNPAQEYDLWHQRGFQEASERLGENSPWYKLVLEYLSPLEGKRVLEVGCGRGRFLTELTARGAVVCGADLSGFAVHVAQERLRKAGVSRARGSVCQADAHHLPFANTSFDVVISCETIEHFIEPETALREMARVTKQGGMLFLTTPSYLNLMGLYRLYDWVRGRDPHSASGQPLDRCWLFFRVRHLLHKAGWRIRSSDGTVHQVPLTKRNPLRLSFPEANSNVRRLLSPLALHYLAAAENRKAAR